MSPLTLTIEPETSAGREKLGEGLQKLIAEDPTFRVDTDQETGQTIGRPTRGSTSACTRVVGADGHSDRAGRSNPKVDTGALRRLPQGAVLTAQHELAAQRQLQVDSIVDGQMVRGGQV